MQPFNTDKANRLNQGCYMTVNIPVFNESMNK